MEYGNGALVPAEMSEKCFCVVRSEEMCRRQDCRNSCCKRGGGEDECRGRGGGLSDRRKNRLCSCLEGWQSARVHISSEAVDDVPPSL